MSSSGPPMTLQIWGVRGSIASPGPATARYGGNTSCVSIRIQNVLLVLDAGTGVRVLGNAFSHWPGDIVIAITHLHWDHVQGFPFFAPIFQPQRPIAMMTPDRRSKSLSRIFGVDGLHFPLKPGHIPSTLSINSRRGDMILARNGARLRRIAVNHPGGCLGYRVEAGGRSIVFIPDNEIDPPYVRSIEHEELIDFCRDADVLIHDAQYLPADFPEKRGWGHSLVEQACDLAHAARVKRLLLFHHDPERDDDAVDAIQAAARERLFRRGSTTMCDAATEGMEIVVA